ncbi:hypothetical protein P8452_15940 [Trifolium repens]|nr:hypothetical protein P8452_15940 [Trifolium repens]
MQEKGGDLGEEDESWEMMADLGAQEFTAFFTPSWKINSSVITHKSLLFTILSSPLISLTLHTSSLNRHDFYTDDIVKKEEEKK